MFDGIGDAVKDRDGICSLGIGWGESECVFGVGDFSDGIGDVIGVKCVDGEGTEFNSGDPMAIEDVSGTDEDDSEMSEISDDGEGVAYGSKIIGNSWISSRCTVALSDVSLCGSDDGLLGTDFSTGGLARSMFASKLAVFLHSTVIDPLMIFSTSSSSLS